MTLGALQCSSTFPRCVLWAAQDRLEGNKLTQVTFPLLKIGAVDLEMA